MRRLHTFSALALLAAAGAPALAQGEMGANQAQPEQAQTQMQDQAETWSPSWSDDGIAQLAGMLSGSWKTSAPVGDEGGGQADIVMNVAPIPVEGVPDTLYVETARSDRLWDPYRQAVFQLFRYGDTIRLRTYEFRVGEQLQNAIVGLGAAPEIFPTITRDDLIATLDVALKPKGDGYAGKTPHPYPTGVGGAVEMTSEVTLTPDSFTTADRGLDAEGGVVWGSGKGSAYTFERVDDVLTADRRSRGVIAIDFLNPGDDVLETGDRVHVHYVGWTAEGEKFDASRDRNRAFVFPYPSPPGRMIEGWDIGIEGISKGAHRKVYLPWEVAYGERGNPQAGIEPRTDLIFHVECLLLEHPEDEAGGEGDGAPQGGQGAEGGAESGSADPHAGHDHD